MTDQFKVLLHHTVTNEQGKDRRLQQYFLFEAVSFSDAEIQTVTYIEKEILKNNYIESIARTKYSEIHIIPETDEDGAWYDVSVKEEEETESGTPRVSSAKYLIFGKSVGSVETFVGERIYKDSMIDFKVHSVRNSGIIEVVLLEK